MRSLTSFLWDHPVVCPLPATPVCPWASAAPGPLYNLLPAWRPLSPCRPWHCAQTYTHTHTLIYRPLSLSSPAVESDRVTSVCLRSLLPHEEKLHTTTQRNQEQKQKMMPRYPPTLQMNCSHVPVFGCSTVRVQTQLHEAICAAPPRSLPSELSPLMQRLGAGHGDPGATGGR